MRTITKADEKLNDGSVVLANGEGGTAYMLNHDGQFYPATSKAEGKTLAGLLDLSSHPLQVLYEPLTATATFLRTLPPSIDYGPEYEFQLSEPYQETYDKISLERFTDSYGAQHVFLYGIRREDGRLTPSAPVSKFRGGLTNEQILRDLGYSVVAKD